jgi:hypothetical protein
MLGAIGGTRSTPGALCAARPARGKVLGNALRHEELGIFRPAIDALGQANFLDTQRFAMRSRSVLAVGRAVTDVAVEDDEGGPTLRLPENVQCVFDAADVICVADAQHIPSVAHEPRGDILGERELRAALDRDVVVVVDPAEVVETEMPRERRCLGAHAFHQAAVTADRVNVEIHDVEAGTVVTRGKPALGNRHADAHRDALPERPRGRLDTRDQVVFGMPRRLAAQLPKPANIVERDRGLADGFVFGIHGLRASEKEHRPQQHRRVTVGQYEAVAIGPDRILRIEPHHAIPQRVHERGQRHRRAGMAGVGGLHRIDR